MKKHLWPFITFWLLDSILLFLAAWVLPAYYVLGNKSMSMIWAAVASGLVWTFLTWIADPILGSMIKTKSKLIMFAFYLIVNFIALWITARLAPVFGFGVTSFVWLVLLAVIADFAQWGVWRICNFKKILK